MKYIKNMVLGLYINLFIIILLLASLLGGLTKNGKGNLILYLLIAGVVISGISNAVFAVKNAINACKLYKNREYNSMRKHMKILKFGAIPYFILNFLLNFFLFSILVLGSRGILLVTPMPLLFLVPIFFTYLTVVFTSSYGIGFATIVNKEKGLKKRNLVFHILSCVDCDVET